MLLLSLEADRGDIEGEGGRVDLPFVAHRLPVLRIKPVVEAGASGRRLCHLNALRGEGAQRLLPREVADGSSRWLDDGRRRWRGDGALHPAARISMASQRGCMHVQQCIRQTSDEKLKLQPKRLAFDRKLRLKRHQFSCSTKPVENSALSSHASHNKIDRSKRPFLSAPSPSRNLDGKTFCSAEICTFGDSATESSQIVSEGKIGVLLLNLGGPDTLHDVEPFLFNLFADPDIIRLPRMFRFLQQPLAKLISVSRAPKSKEGYASIGGGSPLRKITGEQAHALRMALRAKDIPANVYIGMRYWYPFTEEAVHQIKRDKITRLVVLPLYPQYSISTSGSSIRLLQTIFREDPYLAGLPVSIIESWYNRKGYVEAMATLIQKELLTFSSPEEVTIFFSAHGVPLSYVQDAGDPYRDQMEECIDLIMEELKCRGVQNPHVLAYQSRVGPVQWLKPYTDDVIVELGQKGTKSLLAVPVSFVSEHIETLEEIDVEYRELALNSGIQNWGRVPTLGCDSSFIADLAEAVAEALPAAAAISAASKNPGAESGVDSVQRAVNVFFGSLVAFVLLLAPRLLLALRNSVL